MPPRRRAGAVGSAREHPGLTAQQQPAEHQESVGYVTTGKQSRSAGRAARWCIWWTLSLWSPGCPGNRGMHLVPDDRREQPKSADDCTMQAI
jgi:hypothetical protein